MSANIFRRKQTLQRTLDKAMSTTADWQIKEYYKYAPELWKDEMEKRGLLKPRLHIVRRLL